MNYTNSPLVSYTKLSPNHSGTRTHRIDRITPHCVVGQCSVETIGNIFQAKNRQASCNYGIGADGRVVLIVEEKNRSWCSSNRVNDQRAVTIECASDTKSPYAFKPIVYERLVELCADICKRNGKKKLLWLGSKEATDNYIPNDDEMILTVHRWYANKSCPGDWMYARMEDLAARVNAKLTGVPFLVRVDIDNLIIRTGPGAEYLWTGKYTGKGIFTITEEKNGWGKLKSGAGWVSLKHCIRI